MAQSLAIHLQVENGQVVTAELKNIGETGHRALSRISDGATTATRGVSDLGMGAGELTAAFRGLASAAAAYVSIDTGRRVIETADAYRAMQDRIAMATGDVGKIAEAQQRVFDIAQATRAPVQAVGDLYASIGAPLREQGRSLEDQLSVVQMVGQALAINRTSAGAAAGALQQFGQMLGGSVVQAQEFNSLIDGARPLVEAMARGLGVLPSEMKALVEAGLPVERALEALLSQVDWLDERFQGVARGATGAWQQVANEMFRVVGEAANASGAIGGVETALDQVRKAIASPEFSDGISAIAGAFASLFADVTKGVAESVRQIEGFKKWSDDARTSLAAVPEGEGWLGWAARQLSLFSSLTLAATKQMNELEAAAHGAGVAQKDAIGNFAGAANFRAAQDTGTVSALERMAFTAPKAPAPIASPFAPKARPQADADTAYGKIQDAAARAGETAARKAEQALEQARRVYDADERQIDEMLQRMSQAVGERARFIDDAVRGMSPFADDAQIEAMRDAAAAAYDYEAAIDALTESKREQAHVEMEILRLNNENKTAAEQFVQRMQYLDGLKSQFGMSDQAYAAEARKASDEAAAAQEEADQRRVDSATNAYAQMEQIANTAFRGIASGMAEMLVEGEYNFEAFLDGMAKSIIEAGIQQALMGMFSMAFGGAGAGGGASFGNGGLGGGAMFGLYHRGGTTSEPSGSRWMPYSAFDSAPKFHSGRLAPNEMAAIIDRRESILTPGQMSRLQPAGASPNVRVENKVNVINNSPARVETRQEPDGSTTIQIMEAALTRSIATPGSGPRRAVEEVVRRTR